MRVRESESERERRRERERVRETGGFSFIQFFADKSSCGIVVFAPKSNNCIATFFVELCFFNKKKSVCLFLELFS